MIPPVVHGRRTAIHIASTSNEAYAHGLAVTLLSAARTLGPNGAPHFHVFDTGLAGATKDSIRGLIRRFAPSGSIHFYEIDKGAFEGLSTDHGGGHSTYARLLMGSLVPASRCIYIDADFLVLRDLLEVWNADTHGAVMLAVRDFNTSHGGPATLADDCPFSRNPADLSLPYYCCGFMLVDLDEWRRADAERSAFRLLDGFKGCLKAWDQTILNYLLRGKIGPLDPLNAMNPSWGPLRTDGNIHFFSKRKPWNSWSGIPPYRLWRLFHQIHVSESMRNPLRWNDIARGFAVDFRDHLLAKSPAIEGLYLQFMIRRGVPEISRKFFSLALGQMREAARSGSDRATSETLRHFRRLWRDG